MPVQDEIPKSRITLTYKTEVNGEEAVVNLPFRLLVFGDFSAGSSKDRKVDLEERKVRSLNGTNTSEVMRDMNTTLNIAVPNRINPQESATMKVNLAINNVNAFSPQEVAKQVPHIRALLLLKELLLELRANLANKKELNALLNKLYCDKESLQKVKEKLRAFAVYQLPELSEEPLMEERGS